MRNGKRIALVALMLAAAAPAQASMMAVQWYDGSWTCKIDGRPARMTWKVVDASETSCDGDTCSTTSGVAMRGRFSDNGSKWVTLKLLSSSQTVLNMRHPDGNKWQLRRVNANTAEGFTTWNKKRYPLSCRK